MKNIDHQQTIVLLIGATEFPHDEKKNLEPIPNIAVNLDRLKNLLTDSNIMGIPEKNITVSLNETKAEVEGHLADLKKKTSNPKTNLLVYYAGHGYPDFFAQKYHVFLTTYSTNTEMIKQGAISTADFADYIKECNSERKLIILDACYSGELIDAGTMGDADSQITAELNNFSGTYVMTSVSKDNKARFPKENTNAPTYFTGELIEVLENGLNKNEHFLNTKDIFLSVKNNLLKKQLPEPKSHNKDQADDLLWAKNVRFDQDLKPRKEIQRKIEKANELIKKGEYELAKLLLEKALSDAQKLERPFNLVEQIKLKIDDSNSLYRYSEHFRVFYSNLLDEKQLQIDQLNQSIAQKNNEIDKINTRLNDLVKNAKEQKELGNDTEKLKQKIELLQKEKADFETKLKQEKLDVENFKKEVTLLKDKLKQAEEQKQQKTAQAKELENQAKQLKGKLSEYELQIGKLQEQLKNINERPENRNLQALEAENKRIGSQLEEARKNLTKTQTMLNELSVKEKNAQIDITNLQQKLKENYAKLTNLQNEYDDLQNNQTQLYKKRVLIALPVLLVLLFFSYWIGSNYSNNNKVEEATEETVEEATEELENDFTNYTETIAGVSFGMVAVKGGKFEMGKDDAFSYDVHTVELSDFYIGKYEVTVREFEKFISETNYQTDADKSGDSYVYKNNSWTKKKGVNWKCDIAGNPRPQSDYNHPVIHVSWNDANEYCNWLSKKTNKKYSLPSEAQWEYAAGGGANNRTKWAGTNNENDLGTYAWYDKNSYDLGGSHKDYGTHESGTKTKNALGLYDMSGNVWEWCLDWYDENYYKNSSGKDPVNLTQSTDRVYRGGSWYINANGCRVADRSNGNRPLNYDYYLGFRVVRLP